MRHCGQAYHDFILGSPRDRKLRERFQKLVLETVPPHGIILDFGAGTGIDARCYAANGLEVLVHEPMDSNLSYLREYCREEIANGSIAITGLPVRRKVQMIAANFAVLNLIGDHRALFANFADWLAPQGAVLVSLLNPFFLGDARYRWWRSNLGHLVARGAYAVEGEFEAIHRFTPSAVMRAARPRFAAVRRIPGWPALAVSRYMFMLFRKR